MKAEELLQEAQKDYDGAEKMYGKHKYSDCLMFCHKSIEKALKALYIKRHGKEPSGEKDPYQLAKDLGILGELPNIKDNLLDISETLKNTKVRLVWLNILMGRMV